jgi:GAF domain-containing protein
MPYGAPTGWTIDLRSSVGQRELSFHVDVAPLLEHLPMRGSVKQAVTNAASLPIIQGDELVGILILYLGPGVPVDDQMTNFLDLLARQCSTSASMVASYENELQSQLCCNMDERSS